jgi:hypothetical protein
MDVSTKEVIWFTTTVLEEVNLWQRPLERVVEQAVSVDDLCQNMKIFKTMERQVALPTVIGFFFILFLNNFKLTFLH